MEVAVMLNMLSSLNREIIITIIILTSYTNCICDQQHCRSNNSITILKKLLNLIHSVYFGD